MIAKESIKMNDLRFLLFRSLRRKTTKMSSMVSLILLVISYILVYSKVGSLNTDVIDIHKVYLIGPVMFFIYWIQFCWHSPLLYNKQDKFYIKILPIESNKVIRYGYLNKCFKVSLPFAIIITYIFIIIIKFSANPLLNIMILLQYFNVLAFKAMLISTWFWQLNANHRNRRIIIFLLSIIFIFLVFWSILKTGRIEPFASLYNYINVQKTPLIYLTTLISFVYGYVVYWIIVNKILQYKYIKGILDYNFSLIKRKDKDVKNDFLHSTLTCSLSGGAILLLRQIRAEKVQKKFILLDFSLIFGVLLTVFFGVGLSQTVNNSGEPLPSKYVILISSAISSFIITTMSTSRLWLKQIQHSSFSLYPFTTYTKYFWISLLPFLKFSLYNIASLIIVNYIAKSSIFELLSSVIYSEAVIISSMYIFCFGSFIIRETKESILIDLILTFANIILVIVSFFIILIFSKKMNIQLAAIFAALIIFAVSLLILVMLKLNDYRINTR